MLDANDADCKTFMVKRGIKEWLHKGTEFLKWSKNSIRLADGTVIPTLTILDGRC